MMTLIHATPGSGKTLLTVSKVPEWYPDRPVYYYGIPELTLDWIELDDAEKWNECPEGSVIVIDEAQIVFPQRSYQKSVPAHIEAFATHRHKGYDIVLVTQHCMDLDVFIRRRAGRFLVLDRPMTNPSWCHVYEWNTFVDDYTNYFEKQKANRWVFRYPKDSFGVYKSAVEHTHEKRLPVKLKVMLGLAGISVVAVVYSVYYATSEGLFSKREAVAVSSDGDGETRDLLPELSNAARSSDGEVTERWAEAVKPALPGFAFTAPVYEDLMSPVAAPKPQCIASASKCICYTQQSTKLEVADEICREIVENGYFDPSRPDANSQVREVPTRDNREIIL